MRESTVILTHCDVNETTNATDAEVPAEGEGLDVLVAHGGALDLRRAEGGEQVVAGPLAPLPDDRDHVGGELLAGARPGGRHVGIPAQVAQERDDRGVPAVELL
jgi:hypothetical protein